MTDESDSTRQAAREAGKAALKGVKVGVAERLADLIRRDPERAAHAVEMGLIDRDWLDTPGHAPLATTPPLDVVRRFLERSVEQRPSALGQLGLNAITLLAASSDDLLTEGGASDTEIAAVAFTDIEGFTRYTARHGDEAASQLLDAHHRAVGPVIRSRGGRIVKRIGDGLLLVFADPAAAIPGCLEILDSEPSPLRLRAGIHHGEIRRTRDDVIGHVVNLAARITEAAKGGQVLVSAEAMEAAGEVRQVSYGRLRKRSFKGVTDTVRVAPAFWTLP